MLAGNAMVKVANNAKKNIVKYGLASGIAVLVLLVASVGMGFGARAIISGIAAFIVAQAVRILYNRYRANHTQGTS